MLTPAEKREIWRIIRRWMEAQKQASRRLLLGFIPKWSLIISLCLVLLLFGSGISFASDNALPGDVFYPFKLNVSERIASAFLWSKEAQAKWDTDRASERLEEAATLAFRNALDSRKSAVILANFNEHWKDAESSAASLSSSGDLPAASALLASLESALQAHQAILKQLSTPSQPSDRQTALQSVLHTLQNATDSVEASRRSVDTTIDTAANGDTLGTAARTIIARASDVINGAEQELSAGDTFSSRLALAKRLLSNATRYAQTGNNRDAVSLARAALRIAEESSLLHRYPPIISAAENGPGVSSASETGSSVLRQSYGSGSDASLDSALSATATALRQAYARYQEQREHLVPDTQSHIETILFSAETDLNVAREALRKRQMDEAAAQNQQSQQRIWEAVNVLSGSGSFSDIR
jgi:hypothetical protein